MIEKKDDSLLQREGNSGLIMGILIVIAGLVMAVTPVLTFISLTALVAALLFVAGICTLVDVFRRNAMERKMLDGLLGICFIVLAGLIFFNPIGAAIGLTVWIAAWFIVRGVMELAGMGASPYGRGFMAIDALVNIVLGVMLLCLNPITAQAALGFYVAISLIFWGFSLIYRSALLKHLL
ncbi:MULTISPECIES: HdeD family acid-resistance protein [Bombella]|uniref:DUF308 domain-containing protein n=1 Tax=Bombella saccharophila TaxID=2967338 RepID=A0ABT3W424_9PROT|nr:MULTISPECIES: DUF308 domain-containing protein [Bombella]MCT6855787.1 DUF308 domain-containing protein [Bombella apis]MCX5613794.1 DUF308 domain-containing protein [Bombella saccharophila]MUG04331.1 hypothetical protein [Bombella sp. ESL0378]MUG89825.1 hypothetical protein [Bombella sp. ESL0385]